MCLLRFRPLLQDVLARARENSVVKMMVTGGNLDESKKAIELAKVSPGMYDFRTFLNFKYVFLIRYLHWVGKKIAH